MDAKSKAGFINSVTRGNVVPCPKCGTTNEGGSKFCVSCGFKLAALQTPQADAPAFEQVKEKKTSARASRYVEPNHVFAEGLPEWSIEPPQVMVRRR